MFLFNLWHLSCINSEDRKWLRSVAKSGTRPIPPRREASEKQQSTKHAEHTDGKNVVASSENEEDTQVKQREVQKRPADAVQSNMAIKALKKFRCVPFNACKITEENSDDNAIQDTPAKKTSPAAEEDAMLSMEKPNNAQGPTSSGFDQPQDQFVTGAEFDKLLNDVRQLQGVVANMKKRSSAKRPYQTTVQPPPSTTHQLQPPPSTTHQQQPLSQPMDFALLGSALDHAPTSDSPSPSPSILYNGHTIDNLRDSVSVCDKLLQATKIVLFQLFDQSYILSHSVSGRASNAKTVAKPQFDSRLYGALVKVLKDKFPSISDSDITAKIHVIQKMLKKTKSLKFPRV
ncbi:uncharacterized protein LOC124273979 [Haliotis rubra]|uniref:uncharacterized protein LOC124273979 n=1 Tax=Haliotis rubra TaxID=36100 RepID=UPI001EE50EE5|nr:uncharacterized protein LOC124273979 [Haliotis rubra]